MCFNNGYLLHYTGKAEEKAFEHNFKISYQHKRTCLNFNLVKVFYLASSILFLLNFNLILIQLISRFCSENKQEFHVWNYGLLFLNEERYLSKKGGWSFRQKCGNRTQGLEVAGVHLLPKLKKVIFFFLENRNVFDKLCTLYLFKVVYAYHS